MKRETMNLSEARELILTAEQIARNAKNELEDIRRDSIRLLPYDLLQMQVQDLLAVQKILPELLKERMIESRMTQHASNKMTKETF